MSTKLKCEKCKKEHYTEKHHILPQKLFGKNTETRDLCSNCHTEYHKQLGAKYLKPENKQSEEFYYLVYFRWLFGSGMLAAIVYLILI